jgi:hypothetical protein
MVTRTSSESVSKLAVWSFSWFGMAHKGVRIG